MQDSGCMIGAMDAIHAIRDARYGMRDGDPRFKIQDAG